MFIPRIEGVIAAAGSGGGNGNGGGGGSAAPPDTGLATRKSSVLSLSAGRSSSQYPQGSHAAAAYVANGQSAGDASVDILLRNRHPSQGGRYKSEDSFEPFWFCLPLLYGTPSGTRLARLRDVVGAYNTMSKINTSNVLDSAGWTPNQQWMNAAAAVLLWDHRGSHTFGSTVNHANHSGVETRYDHALNFWNLVGERHWKYGYQEIGIGYFSIYLCVSWVLKDKALTSSVQKVGDFLWNQLVLQLSHLYGFDQMALPGARQHHMIAGTPRNPEATEVLMWLLFGGTQYTTDSGNYPLSETQYHSIMAMSSNLQTSAYSVARNIRHTASTHAPFEVKSAERREGHEEAVGRGGASPSYPYIYCTPKYQVGHRVWGSGTLNYLDRLNQITDFMTDNREWQLVVKNTNPNSACNSLVVTSDWNNRNFSRTQNSSATTPYEFVAGLKGTIVSAFNIESGSQPKFIFMNIAPVWTSTAISGNWWFGSATNCYVAVHFARGFSTQASRGWYQNSGGPFLVMPWLRSPGSGSAATHVIAIETADPADYASFSAFQSAVLNTVRNGAAGGIANTNVNTPRITYADLKGNTFDVTYKGSIIVNGAKVTTQHHNGTVSSPHHKRLDTPWVQLDYGGNDMIVTDPADGVRRRHRWSDKTVTVL